MDCNKEFERIKSDVKELIQKCKDNTIHDNPSDSRSGIYMIYIDDFTDNKILPVYIGQTSNFRRRYTQHLRSLRHLYGFGNKNYLRALNNNWFSGKYFYCKLFCYLADHSLKEKDLKMVVLEEIDDPKTKDERENYYIERLLLPYIGFNQVNTITFHHKVINSTEWELDNENKKMLITYADNDTLRLGEWWDYGYSEFNSIIAFRLLYEYSHTFTSTALCKKMSSLIKIFKENNDFLIEYLSLMEYLNETSYNSVFEICGDIVGDFFDENKLKSNIKKIEFSKYLASDDESYFKKVNNYIKRYSKSDILELIKRIPTDKMDAIVKIKQERERKQLRMKVVDDEIFKRKTIEGRQLIPNCDLDFYDMRERKF